MPAKEPMKLSQLGNVEVERVADDEAGRTARSARPRCRSRPRPSTRGGSFRREVLLLRCRSSLPPASRTSGVEAISGRSTGGWARASSRCSAATIAAEGCYASYRPGRARPRAPRAPRRGCRSRASPSASAPGPCRPGRSARSRPGTRAGRRGCRGPRPRRVAQRHADQLLVRALLVRHVEDADRPDADAAAGERRVADEHERVERVAVLAERALDEAVVGGIAHRREQPPVEHDPAELVVALVLVARAGRDLDEDDGVATGRIVAATLDRWTRKASAASPSEAIRTT